MDRTPLVSLDAYLQHADRLLHRYGVLTEIKTGNDHLHGRAVLEILNAHDAIYRPYPRPNGDAEFRTAVRAYLMERPDAGRKEDVLSLLRAFNGLAPFIANHLGQPHFKPAPVSELTIQQLLFHNDVTGPDGLYFGLDIGLADLQRGHHSYRETPDFVDLHEQWNEPIGAYDAVRNAVDLTCLGLWLGRHVRDMAGALTGLRQSLEKSIYRVNAPLYDCLSPGEAWTLRLPLIADGLHGNLIVMIGGGDLSQLTGSREDLVREFVHLAGALSNHLARERLLQSIHYLPIWQDGISTMQAYGGLASAIAHLIAPHRLRVLKVDGEPVWTAPEQFGGVRHREGSVVTPMIWDAQDGNHFFRAEIDFCRAECIQDSEVEQLSVSGRMDTLLQHFHANQGAVSPSMSGREKAPVDPYANARALLDARKGTTVSRKDFFACFVALALLSKPHERRFQISGNPVKTLQKKLEEEEGIIRQRAMRPNPTDLQDLGAKPDDALSIAQMAPSQPDLQSVEQMIGAIELARSHGSLTITVHLPPFSDGGLPSGGGPSGTVPPVNGMRPAA